MGTRTARRRLRPPAGLAAALFSSTQARVIGLLFGQPDRSFYATELIRLVGAGSGAVQRELARLEQSALVTVRRVGTQKHYQANPESPVFSELVGIARKTIGLVEPLRAALAPVAARIAAAFVYGSVAKRSDTARSDIDILILSDHVSYADLYALVESLSSTLGRRVNPVIYSRSDFAQRRAEENAFVQRIIEQPKLWILGSGHDLGA